MKAMDTQNSTCEENSAENRVQHSAAICQTCRLRNRQGWRRIVINFMPSWFSVNMGTGIVSILLHNFPYNGCWLYWISVALFVLNVLLFTVFFSISVLRYTLYPRTWVAMINHPVQSLFLGTFPMGLATIINMTTFVCVPAWESWAVKIAWALWWVDAAISMAVSMFLPFAIMSLQEHQLSAMTAAWLLPIVAPVVAAATGGVVAAVLPNLQHRVITLVASYVLWGTGVPMAMIVLVIYFHRLTIHKLPPREVIVSVFLPLGVTGQGGFGAMQLGKVAHETFASTHNLGEGTMGIMSGDILYVCGWLMALILWGFGLVWMFFALAAISRSKFPFNMGWWGFTFPPGVFAVSTITIGQELPSKFFLVLGAVFSVAVVLLWIMVASRTVQNVVAGNLFSALCLNCSKAEKCEQDNSREV